MSAGIPEQKKSSVTKTESFCRWTLSKKDVPKRIQASNDRRAMTDIKFIGFLLVRESRAQACDLGYYSQVHENI